MAKVFGNTFGLRQAEVKALERLYRRRISPQLFVSYELAKELCALGDSLRRSIGVTIDRRGRVKGVWTGNQTRALPQGLSPPRVGPTRFSGIRYIYVSRNLEGPTHVDSTEAARLRVDSWIRIESSGKGSPRRIWILVPDPIGIAESGKARRLEGMRTIGPLSPHGLPDDFLETLRAVERELEKVLEPGVPSEVQERAMLAGMYFPGRKKEAMTSLNELELLARSALMEVVGKELQARDAPDPRTWLGSGFIEELLHHSSRVGATILIADSPLSPVQARNLSESLGLPVIDRVALILDIFKRRAKTRDSKMRVELARLRYELSRLKGYGKHLSQIGGTYGGKVGVRGKGEPGLELKRRKLREKIQRLKKRLVEREKKRRETRKRRTKSRIPTVSLIGYTNAGKTTVFNGLTGAQALSEDLLFATLDPLARRFRLPRSGRRVVLMDTVGFLRSLPEGLMDAFKATLEELNEASLLVHVIDVSAEDWEEQKASVERTLEDIGLIEIPRIEVFNKADLVKGRVLSPLIEKLGGILVSALETKDLCLIGNKIEETLYSMGCC